MFQSFRIGTRSESIELKVGEQIDIDAALRLECALDHRSEDYPKDNPVFIVDSISRSSDEPEKILCVGISNGEGKAVLRFSADIPSTLTATDTVVVSNNTEHSASGTKKEHSSKPDAGDVRVFPKTRSRKRRERTDWIKTSRRKFDAIVAAYEKTKASRDDKESTVKNVIELSEACREFASTYSRKIYYVGATWGTKGRYGDIAWWYQTEDTQETEDALEEHGSDWVDTECFWSDCVPENEFDHAVETDRAMHAPNGDLTVTQVKNLASAKQIQKSIQGDRDEFVEGALAMHLEADYKR